MPATAAKPVYLAGELKFRRARENRSLPTYLADKCVRCEGKGYAWHSKSEKWKACFCIFGKVGQQCIRRLQNMQVATHSLNFARNAEYIADFNLIARRALTRYEFHALKLRVERRWEDLRLPKPEMYSLMRRVEQKFGREIVATKPYTIFPFNQYFERHASAGRPSLRAMTHGTATPTFKDDDTGR
jgi:hypothetical protein